MRIRPTLAGDIPLLPSIERSAAQAFLSVPGLAWLAAGEVLSEFEHQLFVQAQASWVAVDEHERVMGFLCARLEGDALHIHEVSVAQQAQGQGLGRGLIAQAIGAARGMGCAEVTLTTFAQVPWNAPFYQRLGFAVISQEQLGERLLGILEEERRLGLVGRCAMRMILAG
jgi:GNAT superfamily N-acetyltransferase